MFTVNELKTLFTFLTRVEPENIKEVLALADLVRKTAQLINEQDSTSDSERSSSEAEGD